MKTRRTTLISLAVALVLLGIVVWPGFLRPEVEALGLTECMRGRHAADVALVARSSAPTKGTEAEFTAPTSAWDEYSEAHRKLDLLGCWGAPRWTPKPSEAPTSKAQ